MRRATRTVPDATTAAQVRALVTTAAALPDVQRDVEANHDNNRWWPTHNTDPRMRMLAAGWSTRVSYRMVGTYADVLRRANQLGFDALTELPDDDLTSLITPLGLTRARVTYLRSLADALLRWEKDGTDLDTLDASAVIRDFADQVSGASFKVAQCAVLYTRGYHCGVIPVDSGMVTKLAPALGFHLPHGPAAHEHLRQILEHAVHTHEQDFTALARRHHVTIPPGTAPTWWTHLVLIYFKRLYLNRPPRQLCRRRPLCDRIIGCPHAAP
ncbi:hypothetical protein [Streptomyces sp. NPDC020667]|uniref:hypothetical protein n=1 Tax=Streptomyces sp. NPDC020667 TaxID=3154895 RepID=UPI0033E6F12A